MIFQDLTIEELIELYKSGKSSLEIAKEFNVEKCCVLKKLSKHPEWNNIKRPSHYIPKPKIKIQKKCLECGKIFEVIIGYKGTIKQYCSNKCYKKNWAKYHPQSKEKRKIYKKKYLERKIKKEPFITKKQKWFITYCEMLKKFHKRNIEKIAMRLVKKGPSIKNSLVSRSKKNNVFCNITINDIRNLILEKYGTFDKYFNDRQILYNNLVFDHIIPISKGGESTIKNLQIITRFSNALKGSLDEKSFYILLEWLKTIPDELRKDITLRITSFHF